MMLVEITFAILSAVLCEIMPNCWNHGTTQGFVKVSLLHAGCPTAKQRGFR